MPKAVHLPWMGTDVDERFWLDYTRQPGNEGTLHVHVAGPGTFDEATQLTVDKAEQDILSVRDKGPIRLRPYQHEAIESVQKSWNRGRKAPLVVLPTGAGKTVVAAQLMKLFREDRGYRCIFLAHRKELLSQTRDKIRVAGGGMRTGIVQGSKNEIGSHVDVTIASIQTLGGKSGKRLEEVLNTGRFDLVILDEAHHAVSAQWIRVIEAIRQRNPQVRMMGMTATPGRSDGLALDTVFDEVCFERNAFDLIRNGFLVPPKGFRVNLDLDLDKIKTENGDYAHKQLSKLMNQPRVHEAIVRAWMEFGHNRKTIVFAVDVQHATDLAENFREAGYATDVVSGATKPKDRDAIYERFSSGETKLLLNCEVLTEGFDDPSIECVLFARPTQSQALYVQMMGRGLRPWPGKTECLIVDCVGNSAKHRPVQLASLAGFDPNLAVSDGQKRGKKPGEEFDEEEEQLPEVKEARIRGEEFDLGSRPKKAKYKWRETDFGWVLQIPRIGYYLCAWSDKHKSKCTIQFFDQRPKRRHMPPREVVHDPVDFDLAYGMVEGEMDRFFNARRQRDLFGWRDRGDDGEFKDDDDDSSLDLMSFMDVTDGLEDDMEVEEAHMLEQSAWTRKPMSSKQRDLLLALGAKPNTLPETMREASDMILILQVAKDRKNRVPATQKQMAFLRARHIDHTNDLTKGEAARLIIAYRKQFG